MITQPHSTLSAVDDASLSKVHWRMVLTAGMGFFTDAYDLFIIGTVTTLLAREPSWNLNNFKIAFLNGGSLIAAALGAIFFGYCADKFGRKKMYGIEVLILFFGAIFSALSVYTGSFILLLIFRIFVGFGIGGDYPSSAVIASEYSNRKNRGYLVLLVFGMQALGLIAGPLIASFLLWLRIKLNVPSFDNVDICCILLGLGAIPAASVFYLRRRLAETPRYLLHAQATEVSHVVSRIAGHKETVIPLKKIIQQKLLSRKWLLCLIGTAGAWFLLDVSFYGNGISTPMILDKINPISNDPVLHDKGLLIHTLLSAMMFLFFALPGYLLAAKNVDRIGRKPLQIGGFIMLAICYGAIAFIPEVSQKLWLFILFFGLGFFFTNFGPNTTTFLIPSEIFPTNIRAQGHGISAAVGKMGAFIAAFGFPLLLNHANVSDPHKGFHITFVIITIVCVLGCVFTLLIPEMNQKSIDDSEQYEEAS